MTDNISRALRLLEDEIKLKSKELQSLKRAVSELKRQLPSPTNNNDGLLLDSPKKPRIPWSSAISELFKEYESLKPKKISLLLMEKGLFTEITAGRKASVSSTLTRKVKQGELVKFTDGSYRHKRQPITIDSDTQPEKDNNEDGMGFLAENK